MNWKALKQKALDMWHSLPHQAQAGIVIFVSAAGAVLIHAVDDAGIRNCANWGCVWNILKDAASPHMISTAVFAGAAALRLFYMRPGPGKSGAAPATPPPSLPQ